MAITQQSSSVRLPVWEQISDWLRRTGTFWVAVLLFLVFGLLAPTFATVANVQNIMRQIAITGILAIGMTLVILMGGIDLSVGSIVLFSAALMNSLLFNGVLPVIPAVIVGLLAAMLIGALNGVLIEQARISPVIVTLATQITVRGLGQMILWINNSWLWVRDPFFNYIKTQEWLGIPVSAFLMLVLYAVAAVAMRRTIFGRHIYAIGGNERAASLCGIPVKRVKILVYSISGLCAGIGGVLMSARISAISPGIGQGLEFEAITAVVLGGASLSGGTGRVEKTIIGAVIVGMILNFMTIMGISAFYQRAVTGFIILAAAVLDRLSRGRATDRG
jgi:ribose/xylose/arabinose/galactoside ABC-type transport system permease subunit